MNPSPPAFTHLEVSTLAANHRKLLPSSKEIFIFLSGACSRRPGGGGEAGLVHHLLRADRRVSVGNAAVANEGAVLVPDAVVWWFTSVSAIFCPRSLDTHTQVG